jgi:tRNA A37 threonylcarbamoyladenosine biosynthesis protein TsaE
MNDTQRLDYLDLYRNKLRKELDNMQYDRALQELPVAAVTQPRRPASAWAAVIALLFLAGAVASRAL